MKVQRIINICIAVLLGLSLLSTNATAAIEESYGDTVKITIMGTSDIHGNIAGWNYEDGKDYNNSGLARVYSIVKKVRSENPYTLLIDNGDTIQGTILMDDLYNLKMTVKNPMIDVMNFMGYDSMTLGNHDFNFGLDVVNKIRNEAKFPLLGANIYNRADGSNFAKPYLIKEFHGVRVGILGLTIPSVPIWDGPKVKSLVFKHMGEEARKYVKILKEDEKVDLIIAAAHGGLESKLEADGGDAVKYIAEYCPEISFLLAGHDHISVNTSINGVLVGAPKNNGSQEVVRFDVTLKKNGGVWEVQDRKQALIPLEGCKADGDIIKYAKKYHDTTLDFIKKTIATTKEDLQPAAEVPGIPEALVKDTALVDLINTVQTRCAGADISAAALPKYNANIKAGNISYKSILNLYKTPHMLYGIEVTGKELRDYMELSAAYYNTYKPGDVTISFNPSIPVNDYDMFAGVEYRINISKPAGSRIVDLKFKGKPVSDTRKFKLAINSYRYSVLKALGILKGEVYFYSRPKALRFFIRQYIEEAGKLVPVTDNNWQITGAALDHPLRYAVVQMVKYGAVKIPRSQDGKVENVKSLNVYQLMDEGKLLRVG